MCVNNWSNEQTNKIEMLLPVRCVSWGIQGRFISSAWAWWRAWQSWALSTVTSMNSTFWWVSVTHLDPVWRLVHFDFNELNVLMSHCNSSCFGMMSVHVTCIMASTITIIIISISITVKIIIINIIVVICVRWCEFVQACSIALLCFKALFTNSFDHVHVIGHTRGITLTFHSMLS